MPPAVGPLSEMAAAARQLLGGPEAAQLAPVSGGVGALSLEAPTAAAGSPAAVAVRGMAASPSAAPTAGGSMLVQAGSRTAGQAVLRVERCHAAAVWEEWTGSGTREWTTTVLCRTWKDAAARRGAYDAARALDVMTQSNLNVLAEPVAEVLMRSLVAHWFVSENPKDEDVGEWLRESSLSNWGIPRAMAEDARSMRKLVRATTTSQ